MVAETGTATGEAMITIKAAMGWIVAMAHTEVRIMDPAAAGMAGMIVAQVAITITAAEEAAAVEVTVNITVNNIKVIEVINIKLINDNENEKICVREWTAYNNERCIDR